MLWIKMGKKLIVYKIFVLLDRKGKVNGKIMVSLFICYELRFFMKKLKCIIVFSY